jgi:sigma-B regulation protein RsbU (phosphoserine phosphatase)
MACTIGHNLNNPLSSLSMAVENLKSEILHNSKEKYDEDFKIIELSIEKIKSLAAQLINIQNPEVVKYSDNQNMIKLD